MEPKINKRSYTQWNNSNETLKFHLDYLKNIYNIKLSFIDLVLVGNFKGGNSTIRFDESRTEKVLKIYSEKFQRIENKFGTKKLSELNSKEFEDLKKLIDELIKICYNPETEIKGFKASYLSALLSIYFPDLIPILDRRLLINLGIVDGKSIYRGQIKNIQNFYPDLLEKIQELSREHPLKNLREIDKEYFIKELPEWSKI